MMIMAGGISVDGAWRRYGYTIHERTSRKRVYEGVTCRIILYNDEHTLDFDTK
jgi:hypothetical protein